MNRIGHASCCVILEVEIAVPFIGRQQDVGVANETPGHGGKYDFFKHRAGENCTTVVVSLVEFECQVRSTVNSNVGPQ